MKGHYYDGYIEYKQKRRQSPLRSPKEHKGTVQEFIDMAETQAHVLDSIRPVEHWGMQSYARDMCDYTADPRMLHRAWESLKGTAHGIDGVSPEDIGRYVVYREWRKTCRLHGPKTPSYADTVFRHLDDFALYIFHCALNPERRFRTEHIEFGWNPDEERSTGDLWKAPMLRETIKKLQTMKPGFFATLPPAARAAKIREVENRIPGKTRTSTSTMRLMLPGVWDFDEREQERYRELLRSAGTGGTPMDELFQVFFDGIGKLSEMDHVGKAKSFLADVTPLKYLITYTNADTDNEKERALDGMRKAVNWAAMRWIARLLEKIKTNSKGYRPQPLRRVEIPKGDGGVRTLSLPTALDRIVSKSTLMAIQPVMERVFLPNSVGCRSDKDRFNALATLADRYPASPSKITLVADIQKAFDNVPHDRLMEVVNRYIPNKDARILLERFIRRPAFESGIGLAQGDPLSPLFLNMLLHEHLDVPLDACMKERGLTYFRYVDDLAMFGLSSRAHGEEVIARIDELLRHVGLKLHTQAPKTQIVDLAHAPTEYYVEPDAAGDLQIDRYLGLGLRGGTNGELEFFLPSSWKERLREMYIRAEQKITLCGYAGRKGAYTHILHATESWIQAFAPALQHESKDEITKQIVTICKDASRHPINNLEELHKVWDSAQGWWTYKCSEVQA